MGPCISKVGKFPSLVNDSQSIEEVVDNLKHRLTFQLKKYPLVCVPVGSVSLSEEELFENLTIAINYLITLLKTGWDNINTIHIKSSMGKSFKIYHHVHTNENKQICEKEE